MRHGFIFLSVTFFRVLDNSLNPILTTWAWSPLNPSFPLPPPPPPPPPPGTVYLQQLMPFLIVSGMCVFSVASGLFVFPAIELYYTPAIRVYGYERADGVGRSQDLVIQGFIRYIAIAFVPVVLSSGVIYILVSGGWGLWDALS